jgi:golgi phosphoprotein 3
MLTLCEEFLLLSIHEAKGTFIGSSEERMRPGLAGSMLAELALLGKIQTTNNHRIKLIDDSPANDEVLDEALGTLKESEKDRKVGYWVNAFSERSDKLRKRAVKSLIQKGILAQDEDRLVWAAPSPLQAEMKASAKYLVIRRLRGIVLAQEELQVRDLVLFSLLRACGLLDLVFLNDERKLANRWINEQVFSQAIKDPIIQSIQEIEAAIAAIVEED